jgi:hypothetical protein
MVLEYFDTEGGGVGQTYNLEKVQEAAASLTHQQLLILPPILE